MPQNYELAIDVTAIQRYIDTIVEHYEQTAELVGQWAYDLYLRIEQAPEEVSLQELIVAQRLHGADGWDTPAYAQNRIYKLLDSQGKDVAGWS